MINDELASNIADDMLIYKIQSNKIEKNIYLFNFAPLKYTYFLFCIVISLINSML
jgi:hypothetical protein